MARQAQTGRQFGAERQRYGLSQRTVAKLLGVAPLTLQRKEISRAPVAPDFAAKWQSALHVALANKAMELAEQGYTPREIGGDLGRALALATSRQIGGAS